MSNYHHNPVEEHRNQRTRHMTKTQYRQGDVLLVRDDDAAIDGETVNRDRGHVVLAYGEQTGHAHAIASKAATLFTIANVAYRVLELKEAAKLKHGKIGALRGDHETITLPAGRYRVIRQREFSPEGDRYVAD